MLFYLSTEFPWCTSWGGNESDVLNVVTEEFVVLGDVDVKVVMDCDFVDDETMGKSS